MNDSDISDADPPFGLHMYAKRDDTSMRDDTDTAPTWPLQQQQQQAHVPLSLAQPNQQRVFDGFDAFEGRHRMGNSHPSNVSGSAASSNTGSAHRNSDPGRPTHQSRVEEDSDDDADAPLNLLVQATETAPLIQDPSHGTDSQQQILPIELRAFENSARRGYSSLKSALTRNSLLRPLSPTRQFNSPTNTAFQNINDSPRHAQNISPRRFQHFEQFQHDQQQQAMSDDEGEMAQRNSRSGEGGELDEDEILDSRTRAFRIWANVDNVDDFLGRIYSHFLEKGFYAAILSRITNLTQVPLSQFLILGFMISFSTFIFSCIDHSQIHKHKQLSEVIIPECLNTIPGTQAFFLILFVIWWTWQLFHLMFDIPKLYEIKLVYQHLLDIKESDMDTVEWQEIVQKLSQVRQIPDVNPRNIPGLDTLDAHTIVNRIMRKDNYLVAMFNKDVLNLRIPRLWASANRGPMVVTKIMEWNLYFCVLLYAFDEKGGLRKRFLKNSYRRRLVVGLQKRFELMAILNLLFAPFLLVIMILYFVFKYTEEYQKSPTALGARQFTHHARWKLREFNELPHTFQTRLNRAYPKANKYLEQFPKQKQILVARMVSFVCGAIVAALAMLAIVDHELTDFEITPGRSALFYITVFGGVLAAARGMIPEDTKIFEPERLLKEVIDETHNLPNEWRGRLHTEEVKNKFSLDFTLQITQFLMEIASVLLCPFILYYSLPATAESVVDFFRDFTADMEGVGFVCSFAAFDLRGYGNPQYGVPNTVTGLDQSTHPSANTPQEHQFSKEGKMEQSFLYFKANYPQWDVGADGSQYLQALSRSQRFGNAFPGGGTVPLKGESMIVFDPSSVRGRRNVKFGGQPNPPNNGVRPLTESRLGMSGMAESGTEDEPVGLSASSYLQESLGATKPKTLKKSSCTGFEPALPKGNALAGRRVNHSANRTLSV
ncbi:hypothetical protein CcCBS67573_g03436 [Chytriomyces confervae]|uniref:Autophagy-related protein 9 n=1 Tax=Chytriomyces confervae TaxID=246404 RepID=A0A507FGE7_9FUNG|nr:hypothetical protein CcCBS67573_g03436 [Chytriomyces confervae]